MAELIGMDLTSHLDAIFREYENFRTIYGYPERKFFRGYQDYDFSIDFHDRRAATPLGPASGPHSQMAQNIVLAFLGGGRIMELKTVQILDRLEIPRPCIDIRNIGFNVEWSQELALADSCREYITAWILLKIITESELPGIPKSDPFYNTIFDISVGYDLEGISSPAIQQWLTGMTDASSTISEMLSALPDRYARFRELKIEPEISNSATLSTFHGCPRQEIEAIMQHLISWHRLHAIVKLNPTVLGYDSVAKILHDKLGYKNIELDPGEFESDLQFDDMVAMMQRLKKYAGKHGRNIGAKFTNTLVVKNNETIFKDDTMYLSGPPLHVLAMHAVKRFRAALGDDIHVSFSAGIDKHNFADAVSCNMKPVSVCTDLLKTGGYTRMFDYMLNLKNSMNALNARNIDQFIQKRARRTRQTGANEAGGINTKNLTTSLTDNPRYHISKNQKVPPKIDSHLQLFDCITCNKCLPVCPNAANFSIPTGTACLTMTHYRIENNQFIPVTGGEFVLEKENQIANLADFCNDCGDCDTYCPEDGGPYIEKPRFFFSKESYETYKTYDGFYLPSMHEITGRIADIEYSLAWQIENNTWLFRSPHVEFLLDETNKLIAGKLLKTAIPDLYIGMKPYFIMKTLLLGIKRSADNYAAVFLRKDTDQL